MKKGKKAMRKFFLLHICSVLLSSTACAQPDALSPSLVPQHMTMMKNVHGIQFRGAFYEKLISDTLSMWIRGKQILWSSKTDHLSTYYYKDGTYRVQGTIVPLTQKYKVRNDLVCQEKGETEKCFMLLKLKDREEYLQCFRASPDSCKIIFYREIEEGNK